MIKETFTLVEAVKKMYPVLRTDISRMARLFIRRRF